MIEGQDEGEITPDELVEEMSGASARTSTGRSRRRDPLIGEVLDGRYEIIRLIARGGMGRIYAAEQSALGRRVALKVMDLGYSEELDPDFQKRFFLEASTCAQLSHPNTIRVFDYGADGDIFYIAMELIEGRTLLQAIHDAAPLPATRVMHIARQICGSLSEAHRKGIIHRDLKPSNVLLTQHGEETDFAKVLDFGLVKLLREDAQEITRSGLFLGSPNYMSPEQIRATDVDQRSDLYSLGVILFMALTGRAPFKRNSSINVLLAQLEELPPMLSDVAPETDASPALQWAVMNCLEKDANARFGSVDELNKALKACQREERGEYDAPLHLRLEAGRLVESTVPPGMDPVGVHGLRRQVKASSLKATIETSAPNSLPRPQFGYTPSVRSQGSGAGWGPSLPPQPLPSRISDGKRRAPQERSLPGKPATSSSAGSSGFSSRPPSLSAPSSSQAGRARGATSLAMQQASTPVPGADPHSASTRPASKELREKAKKTRERTRRPSPTFWERYGVMTLSLISLLLAVTVAGLFLGTTTDNNGDEGLTSGSSINEVMVPLRSDPVGASVLKDSTALGVTPLVLAMPQDSSWELTVVADGYEAQRLVVSSGDSPDLVTLIKVSEPPPDIPVPKVNEPSRSVQAPRVAPKPATKTPAPKRSSQASSPKPIQEQVSRAKNSPQPNAEVPPELPRPEPVAVEEANPAPPTPEPTPSKKMRVNDVRDPWAD